MVSSTIEHVAITVSNINKSIEFYTNKIGFSARARRFSYDGSSKT